MAATARVPVLLRAAFAALAGLAAIPRPAHAEAAADARKTQEIAFAELPTRTVADAPFALSAKSSSGLPVAFEVVAGPAVMEKKALRLTGSPGLVIILARQEGNEVFQAARPAERAFSVVPVPVAPAIVSQPTRSLTVEIGSPLVLEVTVSGEPAPAFQWSRDGSPVSGGNSRTFTIPAVSLSDAGSYEVSASNALGAATSQPARVTVGKRHQTVMFQGQNTIAGGQPVVLMVGATSGLTVTLEVVSGVATLNGNVVTATSGTVSIRASQPGNSVYEAATPVIQNFFVSGLH
jgi:hypothetical protein